MIERTYAYRLYPNKTEQKRFEMIADACRALYNQMLKDRTEHYRKTCSWKRLNPEPFIKESLIMKDLDTSYINGTVARLERAYRMFFHIRNTRHGRYRPEAIQRVLINPRYRLMDTDLIGYPKIKFKDTKESLDVGTSAVKLMPGRVYIPQIGNIKIVQHRPFPENAETTYYTIIKKPAGHFYLLIHLQMPELPAKPVMKNAIGITLVPDKLVQCSDGYPIQFRHQSYGQTAKINRAYLKLSGMTPGSNRYEKQRKYLASLYEKRKSQRHDSLHKAANAIVKKADVLVIEEPLVLRKKKRLTKMGAFETVRDEAWWTFHTYLKYKSMEAGKRLWRAPGALPVRSACSICGVIAEAAQNGPCWTCPTCAVTMPAEINAAKNLERFGNQYIKEWNEEQQQGK